MRVLIIGGTGNISRATVAHLLAEGHQVTLLNRGSSPPPDGAEQRTADCRDPAALDTALAGGSWDAAVDFLGFTVEQVERIHAALVGKVARYAFISSATVYRKPHELPVGEDHPRGNEWSAYARNKAACEDWLLERGERLPVTIVRPSHTFSERWIPSPLHGFDFTVARRILDGREIVLHDSGRSLWALTASEDFAVGLTGLLDLPAAAGECYHITTDEVLTWNAITAEIGRALGAEPTVVHIPTAELCRLDPAAEGKLAGDKAHHGVFDNAKIRAAVPAFTCRSQREALGRSVAWYLADPARQVVDAEVDAAIDRTIAAWRAGTAAAT